MIYYRVKVLSLLGDKKQNYFHVETCGNTSDGKCSELLVPLLVWTNHCDNRANARGLLPYVVAG